MVISISGVVLLLGTSGYGVFANSIFQIVTSFSAVHLLIVKGGGILFRSGSTDVLIDSVKTRSVFDRYNIVNASDLRMAAAMQEEYLKNQKGTDIGTIDIFGGQTG